MKIQLGCGDCYKKGFVNIDYYDKSVADQIMPSTKLTFKDNSISLAEANYFLEHLSYVDCYRTIEEIYRVLIPNGAFLLKVPNYEKIVREWLKQNNRQKWRSKWSIQIWGGQWHVGHFHKIGFSPYRLRNMLWRIGFREIERVRMKVSQKRKDFPDDSAYSITFRCYKHILTRMELKEKYLSCANEFFEYGFRKEGVTYLKKVQKLEPDNPLILVKIGQMKLRDFLCGINKKSNLDERLPGLKRAFGYFVKAIEFDSSERFKRLVIKHMFFYNLHDGMNEKRGRSKEIYQCFKKIYPECDLIRIMKFML